MPPLSQPSGDPGFSADINGNGTERHERQSYQSFLDQALQRQDRIIYSNRHSAEDAHRIFASVERIISDADGTMLPAGGVMIGPGVARKIAHARAQAGVETILLTGKPVGESEAVMDSLPADVHMPIICEKGAYILRRDIRSNIYTEYHLSSPKLEAKVRSIRRQFDARRNELEAAHDVRIVDAGDGGHQSLLSIDIMRSDLPENYRELNREKFKVLDEQLLSRIKTDIAGMLREWGAADWMVTDLGNGNLELHDPILDKRAAAEKMLDKPSLLLVDSGNDRTIAQIGRERDDVHVGVVYHERTPADLLEDADFATAGEATAERFLAAVLQAKGIPEGLMVATNTAPFSMNESRKRLDIKIGMPVAIADLVARIDNCMWIYTGDSDFSAYARTEQLNLKGKLIPVPVTEEEKLGHYAQTSNQMLWPAMHKPEAEAPVVGYGPETWHTYSEVNRRIAHKLHEQVRDFHAQPEHRNSVATLWVQDYQMMAVAEHFRALPPEGEAVIAFSWHIPFPEPDVLRREIGDEKMRMILEWIARYDLISFHTDSYAQNYAELCRQMDVTAVPAVIKPISVDEPEIRELTRRALAENHRFIEADLHSLIDINGTSPNGQQDRLPDAPDEAVAGVRDGVRNRMRTILCGMERCDDTKASVDRLKAWRDISRTNPELFNDAKVLEVLVRSREGIPLYDELYAQIDELIGEINANVGREAVIHVPRINQREDVIAAMAHADAIVMTPRRDGYNMSAAEAAVVLTEKHAQGNDTGTLLISDGMGFQESLESEGIGEAIEHVPVPVSSATLRGPLERVLAGTTRPVNYEQLDGYFMNHTQQSWTAEIMIRAGQVSFGRRYQQVAAF